MSGIDQAELDAKIAYTVTLGVGTLLALVLVIVLLVIAWHGWRWWSRWREPVLLAARGAMTLGGQLVGGLELVAKALQANLDQAADAKSAAEDARAAREAGEALLEGQGRIEGKLDEIHAMLRGEGPAEDLVRGSSAASGAVRVPGQAETEGARA